MKMTLEEIARLLEGKLIGAADTVIKNIRPIDEAKDGDITFLANRKYLKQLNTTGASAIIVPPQTEAAGKNLIVVKDAYASFGKLLQLFYPLEHDQKGVSPEAYIEKGAVVSDQANIFPRAYISRGAKIEKGAVVYPGAYIGRDVSIGEDSIIYANVTIYHSCVVGKRVILHSGVVIGADGFGFANPGKENSKIPQVGIVQIDDDVEIGANTAVDRATLGKTWIARNVKIDNLVQIAHNVVLGENSVLAATVAIAGSTKLGKSVIVGGQTGIVGHINIGDNVMIGGASKIHKDIAPGEIVGGAPQMPYKLWLKSEACRSKLPEMKTNIDRLVRKIEELEDKIRKSSKAG